MPDVGPDHGEKMIRISEIIVGPGKEKLFWSKVDFGAGLGNCWIWTGYTDTQGYGNFNIARKAARCHSISWIITRGAVPDGMMLDHRCGNRKCVNPDHLRVCSRQENQRNLKKSKANTSGFKGVYLDKRRGHWVARIRMSKIDGVMWIGSFRSAELAHDAYCRAAIKYHGEFANSGVSYD